MNVLVTLDGAHYLRAAAGHRVPSPYHRRYLLPAVLGPHPRRWVALTAASLAATPALAWLYFGAVGLTGGARIFAAALLSSLPAMRFPARFPVLLDAPSFAGALLVAWASYTLPWWAPLPLALLLGATRETAPVFAALWSWSPLPLLGLLAVGWWKPCAPVPPGEPWLEHPFRSAWEMRRRLGFDGSLYVRPWGAALFGLGAPSWQMAITVAVAHAQLFAAVDAVRLAVWCAPVLCAAAARAIPPAWWALALVVTLVQREERA